MRIGIITLPLHTNYGGILQAYALQTVLERMGHEVCLIEEKRLLRLPLWKAPLSYGKRILMNLTGHPFPIFYEQKVNRERPIIQQYTDYFIHKYIKRRIVNSFSEIIETDFYAIVVGSDQIWRPKYFPQIEHAYLDFTEGWNIRRIAYAASFGTDEWEYTDCLTENCSRLIKRFDAVSVREKLGVDLCRDHLNVKAIHVLDPTMLLDANDYIRLFKAANTPKSSGNMLCYILDETPEKEVLINNIAKKTGLIPFRVNSKVENYTAKLEERIQPPVEQWLRGFHDAEFVITDSFHACVFSILFNKPFIVFGNASRGMSRFKSLLEIFGLTDRIIMGTAQCNIQTSIDWNVIIQILNNKRKTANEFLSNSLLSNNGNW